MYQETLEENVKPTHGKYLTLLRDAPDEWNARDAGDTWNWSETIEELKRLNDTLDRYLNNAGGYITGLEIELPIVREHTWKRVYDDEGNIDSALTREANRD